MQTIKCVVVGDGAVGKVSPPLRFAAVSVIDRAFILLLVDFALCSQTCLLIS